jgi:MFS family permease
MLTMSSIDKSHDMETAVPTKSNSSNAKGSIEVQIDGETYSIDAAAERRLVRKFDLRILPILSVMYLFNALDKANLGNAKTNGLEKDLGMLGTNQYNIVLSVFFVPYVLTAPFLAIVGKKYGPSRVLPAMMFTFGSMTVLVVAVQNFSGLFALRWFLGMAESKRSPEKRIVALG